MTDVTVDEPGFTVTVSSPSVGDVSVAQTVTPSVAVPVDSTEFTVSVTERPTGQLAVDGLDPGEYIKSLASLDSKIAVNVDGAGNATVKHNNPGIATSAYAGYPTVIRTDATGHIVAITVESDKAAYQAEIGLGDIAARNSADFLGVDNTTLYGRAFATSVDSAAARSYLGLGNAATYSYGDFAPAVHTHDAADIVSGRIGYERLPISLRYESSLEIYFQSLDGGTSSTSSFSDFDDMFVGGSRFNGGTP